MTDDKGKNASANSASSCPEGTRLQESKQGTLVETVCVKPDGTRHGPLVSKYNDGSMAQEGQYEDGREVGTWIWWHRKPLSGAAGDSARGPRKREGRYRDGSKVGVWKEWAADGPLVAEEIYDEAGKPSGTWKQWWDNGKPKQVATYVAGEQTGALTRYHANGTKSEEGRMNAGKRVDEWTSWHANGQKQWQGKYVDDKQLGPWTWWDESGKVSRECTFTEHGPEGQCSGPT